MRDDYARNLEEGLDEEYEAAFNRAVAKRWPMFCARDRKSLRAPSARQDGASAVLGAR